MSGPDSSGRRIDSFDVVAFDADDTLWRSEDSFAHAEQRFAELVGPYVPTGVDLDAALRATEKADVSISGYGVKAFTLSMVRSAIEVTEGAVPSSVVGELVDLGRAMLTEPVHLLAALLEQNDTVVRPLIESLKIDVEGLRDTVETSLRRLPILQHDASPRLSPELQQVLDHGGVTRIMMDNFEIPILREAVAMVNRRFETEASGGITLNNVRAYAETGVDYVSSGALTHSAGTMDMSLKITYSEG